MRWSPDGRGLAYINNSDLSCVVLQPVFDDKDQSVLASVLGEQITGYGWSHDGKRFAIVRKKVMSDGP